MTIREIGCCGAYCKSCRASVKGNSCPGCKLGYENGERDINQARCKIKVCCFRDRQFETCADCNEYSTCKIIHGWYGKNGYKYGKYRQSMEFIRKNGYEKFLHFADVWKGPYGKIS
jgi:hypothetical protein